MMLAMKGAKPTPTVLKLLRGNPGRRPINEDEPVIKKDLDTAPEWLSESQKTLWNTTISECPKGLLKSLDESVLIGWVVACDLHRQATVALGKQGLIVKSPNGHEVQNPNLAIINRQALIMLKAAAEMGFTPSSRGRIKIKNEIPTGSKFQQFSK